MTKIYCPNVLWICQCANAMPPKIHGQFSRFTYAPKIAQCMHKEKLKVPNFGGINISMLIFRRQSQHIIMHANLLPEWYWLLSSCCDNFSILSTHLWHKEINCCVPLVINIAGNIHNSTRQTTYQPEQLYYLCLQCMLLIQASYRVQLLGRPCTLSMLQTYIQLCRATA